MKRFVIIVTALGVLGIAAFYAKWCYGFYIDFHPEAPVDYVFTVKGKKVVMAEDAGEIRVKGVEVSSGMPEHASSDFAADKEDYLRWFAQIDDMGANTVKVSGIMNAAFYEALYEFNQEREEPLWLLQGILVQDAANYGAGDAFESDYMGTLLEEGRQAVDVIHGNCMIMRNVPGRGTGWYRKDISPWVIGFLVGSEWGGDTVTYTDHETVHSGVYTGTYFTTAEGASPFEAMLAQVMDEMTAYESEKYKAQHLIGFVNSPDTDMLEYRDDYGALAEKYQFAGTMGVTYARQLNKICQIDAEHVLSTEKMKAGYFAAYSLYDFCDDFSAYLTEEQKTELAGILNEIDTRGVYGGYTEFLSRYHTMPVFCVSYGFSTARGVVSQKGFPLTEEEQGNRLVEMYESLSAQGWNGAVINGWQDRWELKSWNTAYAQDFTNNSLWHDIHTESQGYGLMEYCSNSRVIDGNPGEWDEEDVIWEDGGLSLSAAVDGEGLALLVQGEEVSPEKPLYIPVDTTRKSGSKISGNPALSFSRPADFIICIDGKENSRVLVQERYESVRANFQQEIDGENAYISFPEKDSQVFKAINMVMENTTMVEYVDYTNRDLKYLPTYEIGKLRLGNGNPEAKNYDSLADFCYGTDCVELRIPWALLNVANPADWLIHDDYYENYGVEFIKADSFWLGVSGSDGEEITMEEFPLEWAERIYEERTKESYDIVREAWK